MKMKIIPAVLFLGLLISSEAHAMHLSEGLLPLGWAGVWFALAVPFMAFGLAQLRRRAVGDLSFKPLVGLLTAVVFIISCMPIPVPTAGTCSHPAGTGISAVLLGPWISVLVASAALLIQALFLAHGGLSTLGANIVSMGIAGSFAGYLVFIGLRKLKVPVITAGFLAGIFADWGTYLATAAELALGIKGSEDFLPLFTKITIAFIPTQLPLGIIEGAMTAGVVGLLLRKRPDILLKIGVLKSQEVKG
jgi:cobalt/nickel transport system permease protein